MRALLLGLLLVACGPPTIHGAPGSSAETLGPPAAAPAPTGNRYRVACLGDSITQGVYLANPYPHRLGELLTLANDGNAWEVVNMGAGGEQTPQILGRWRSDVLIHGFTHLVLLGGINDINFGGADAGTIYTNLLAIIREAEAAGLVVAVSTVWPFGDSPLWNQSRQDRAAELNGLIRLAPATVVDGYRLMALPWDPTKLNPAWSWQATDGIHPNLTGAEFFAGQVKGALTQ